MNGTNSLIGLIILVLQVVALVDIIRGPLDNTSKLLWALFVIFIPLIGVIVYFIVVKKVLN